jgi:hypothetical protein
MPLRSLTLALLLPALAVADPPAVAELFEDDTAGLIPQLTKGGIGGGEEVKAEGEAADVFAGARSLRVAAAQRFSPDIMGWAFPIAEKPKPGEYRYLRLAWKKLGEGPLMVQFHTRGDGADWHIRYHAGTDPPPWQAKVISTAAPVEWAVVTRDLFADFGQVPFTLTGMAFTPMDGFALFDHVYLGRTLEDLDKVTNSAKEWSRKTEPLGRAQLDDLWTALASADATVAQPAAVALGACGSTSVPDLAGRMTIPDPAVAERRMAKAVLDLDNPRYAVRDKATRELEGFGPTALPRLEEALKRPDLTPEWRTRLEKLTADIKAENQVLTAEQRRTLRVIHVLEMAETTTAKELLTKLSKANLEAGLSGEAQAALERLGKRGK